MWRDPEGTVLRIVSQTENDKPFHLTCVIDKDQAHRNGEQTGGGGQQWAKGTNFQL